MAWFAGSMPQMKWPGKQMREPFGCNQRAGGREKKRKVWEIRHR